MLRLSKQINISDTFEEIDQDRVIGSGSYAVSGGVLTYDSPDTASSAYGYISLFCDPNSVIEVQFEAKQNAGSMGRVGIQSHASKQIGGNLLDSVVPDSGDWKPYKISFPITVANPYCHVDFGVYGADIGNISLRNIVIRVYNSESFMPDIRGGVLEGNSGAWSVYEGVTAFSNRLLTNAYPSGQALVVEFEEIKCWPRPITQATLSDAGIGAQISDLKILAITNNSLQIKAYNRDGTQFDLSAFTGDIYIHLMVFGW